mmetsp:Transcript_25711/g.70001  ORF Transcript_25711/g.70001 Transcript_25711/m.70001 type:complete len:303 (+) Transcript_25711:486-1394(+)
MAQEAWEGPLLRDLGAVVHEDDAEAVPGLLEGGQHPLNEPFEVLARVLVDDMLPPLDELHLRGLRDGYGAPVAAVGGVLVDDPPMRDGELVLGQVGDVLVKAVLHKVLDVQALRLHGANEGALASSRPSKHEDHVWLLVAARCLLQVRIDHLLLEFRAVLGEARRRRLVFDDPLPRLEVLQQELLVELVHAREDPPQLLRFREDRHPVVPSARSLPEAATRHHDDAGRLQHLDAVGHVGCPSTGLCLGDEAARQGDLREGVHGTLHRKALHAVHFVELAVHQLRLPRELGQDLAALLLEELV